MVVTPLALLLAVAQRSPNQYTLDYLSGSFVARNGAKKETIPLQSSTKAKSAVSFRIDQRWAVWDDRGLTTRDEKWTHTDRLEAVATSPRAQERDAIRDTLDAVKTGKRKLAANGLSGYRRIGNNAYFLVRWDDKDGKPWLEALVAADLSKPRPKPRLVGVFPGLSIGEGLIDDRMGIQNGRLVVAVNGEEAWGYANYNPANGTFGFDERGRRLIAQDGDRIVEATSYGSVVVGRQKDDEIQPWMELRGEPKLLPGEGPTLVQVRSRLHNAESGAEFRLARNAEIRRAKAGVLVFWPAKNPRSARLLDYERLEELARWERGTRSSEGERKKRPVKSEKGKP